MWEPTGKQNRAFDVFIKIAIGIGSHEQGTRPCRGEASGCQRRNLPPLVLPRSLLTRVTSSDVVIRALMEGMSKGDATFAWGTKANSLPSLRRIMTRPVDSAWSRIEANFCLASE